MSWYDYEDGREQKNRLRETLQRKQKNGEKFEPLVVPQGSRKLASTFWGKAWCDHLEIHSDYEHRLPRGRSYLRQGNVYNLEIEPGVISAQVAGSSLYEVRVTIRPLAKEHWERIKEDCAGQVASLLDLLGGKLGDGVLRTITDAEGGLFPKPKEISLSCSCPDWADMCKHTAAVLYGVGVRLDTAPDLFFVLRSVDPSELLKATAQETLASVQASDDALAGEDLSALFGIDLAVPEAMPDPAAPAADRAPGTANKAAKAEHRGTEKAGMEAPQKARCRGNAGIEAPQKTPRRGNAGMEAPQKASRRGNAGMEAPQKASRRGNAGMEAPQKAPRRGNAGMGAPQKAPRRGNAGMGTPQKAT